jgi:hypothetical protein
MELSVTFVGELKNWRSLLIRTSFAIAFVILGGFIVSVTSARADPYCAAQYKLDALVVPSQLKIYQTLNAGGHVSEATWNGAEVSYQKSFAYFREPSMQYCDAEAQLENGLAYTLHTINRYLYDGTDLKWAANWLQNLEGKVGIGDLTPELYRSLLLTTLHGLQNSHEHISEDFRDLVNKYVNQPR